jgi:hypothetical protein
VGGFRRKFGWEIWVGNFGYLGKMPRTHWLIEIDFREWLRNTRCRTKHSVAPRISDKRKTISPEFSWGLMACIEPPGCCTFRWESGPVAFSWPWIRGLGLKLDGFHEAIVE